MFYYIILTYFPCYILEYHSLPLMSFMCWFFFILVFSIEHYWFIALEAIQSEIIRILLTLSQMSSLSWNYSSPHSCSSWIFCWDSFLVNYWLSSLSLVSLFHLGKKPLLKTFSWLLCPIFNIACLDRAMPNVKHRTWSGYTVQES